jgi:hypothetical protein
LLFHLTPPNSYWPASPQPSELRGLADFTSAVAAAGDTLDGQDTSSANLSYGAFPRRLPRIAVQSVHGVHDRHRASPRAVPFVVDATPSARLRGPSYPPHSAWGEVCRASCGLDTLRCLLWRDASTVFAAPAARRGQALHEHRHRIAKLSRQLSPGVDGGPRISEWTRAQRSGGVTPANRAFAIDSDSCGGA